MKDFRKILYILLLGVFIGACSSGDKTSDAFGNFEADEIIISAETPGRILSITVREGEIVKKGKVLARIDSTDLLLKKQQLVSQMNAIQGKLSSLQAQEAVFIQQKDNLQKDLARVTAMKKEGAATSKQLEDVEGGIAMAEKQAASVRAQKTSIVKQVESIMYQIDEVERTINKAEVSSPIEGTVLSCFAKEGELAAPGRALFKLADLRVMKLKVYISERQLSGLKLGQSTEVIVDDPAGLKKLQGKISWISDEAEFTPKIIQTRDERVNMVYALEVQVVNDGTLKIGMPGEVNFTGNN